jgi:hypothetical protein
MFIAHGVVIKNDNELKKFHQSKVAQEEISDKS